ncbi:MAG: glycosyltransferase [Nitrospira sp.]|nr:glycosyltransferase [Nitrospira sp.]MCA9499790.1 glycosyltransferase [Nitrospira sp.]
MAQSEAFPNLAGLQKPRVLLLTLDYRTWHDASHFPYPDNLGLEEALIVNGADCVTIPVFYGLSSSNPASWMYHAKQLCSGRQFDVVWFDVNHMVFDEATLDWLSTLAPIRIGFFGESIQMDHGEYETNPEGARTRLKNLATYLQYVTHAIVVDECDRIPLEARGIPVFWWKAGAVPKRFVCDQLPQTSVSQALFFGTLYGERKTWLERPELAGLLSRPSHSPEWETDLPRQFDDLVRKTEGQLVSGGSDLPKLLQNFLDGIRHIRGECFRMWLQGLQAGLAVVNLPQFGKAYASRVVQGMAAGRPVISWEIPDRPLTKELFQEGKEILLFPPNDPRILGEHIRKLQCESRWGRQIAEEARRKVLAHHTSEFLMKSILEWVGVVTQTVRPSHDESPPSKAEVPEDFLHTVCAKHLWQKGRSLRLHLGCGEQHLDGYVNVDYPSSEHNVMTPTADVFWDLQRMKLPDDIVDEIRCHHVFEHFNRVNALAMLMRWHRWLKCDGLLYLETPDLMGCAQTFISTKSLRTKMGIVRHLVGDQTASWGFHVEQWFPERFVHTLERLGFAHIETKAWSWPHEPYLSNVVVAARKAEMLSWSELLRRGDMLLWESTVSDEERPAYEIWRTQLRQCVRSHQSPGKTSPANKSMFSSSGAGEHEGNVDSERVRLRQILQVQHRSPDVFVKLAQVELNASDISKARRYLRAALSLEPNHSAANALIATVSS